MSHACSADGCTEDSGPTRLERLVRHAGARLMVWSRRHGMRRADRAANRIRPLRIFDPATPEAVRRNGVPPGIIR